MTQELKTYTLNLKSLDQKIQSPILVGGGDANGRTFCIIFTQEAADMFTKYTKVYLKWYHQTEKTRGYNVFQENKKEEDFRSPQVWEMKFPRMMLYEGDVTCTIEVVDDISISASTTFLIHVTADPYYCPCRPATTDETASFKALTADDVFAINASAINCTVATATTATKLSTSAGSATQPVFFSSGKPVACTSCANATVKSATSAANEYSVISGTSQPTDSRCKVWLNTDGSGNLSAVYAKI